jgi:hypothetical protein
MQFEADCFTKVIFSIAWQVAKKHFIFAGVLIECHCRRAAAGGHLRRCRSSIDQDG